MAEFENVMTGFARMCKYMMNQGCRDCPLELKGFCEKRIHSYTQEDIQEAEEIIAKWVAEHPESEYPTWYEWLSTTPFMEKVRCGSGTYKVYNWKKPIPADIAEKLGIEPKR